MCEAQDGQLTHSSIKIRYEDSSVQFIKNKENLLGQRKVLQSCVSILDPLQYPSG